MNAPSEDLRATVERLAALDRLKRKHGGTIAAVLACIERGASVVRVHDVGQVRQAIAVFEAIEGAGAGAGAGTESVSQEGHANA